MEAPAAASAPPWIPEDDIVLKNALEAGASLEALAKGAVRFSRKFTVAELRERWHSLLYDADISAEASSRMLEFEAASNSNSASKSRSSSSGSSRLSRCKDAKRKPESIRKYYNAMRKKLRAANLVDRNCYQKDFFDHSFLYPPPHVGNGEVLEGNFGVGDHNEPLFVDCNAGDDDGAANVFRGRECVLIGNHKEQVSLFPGNGLGENSFFHDDSACEDLPTNVDSLINFGNALDVEDIGPSHVSADEPLWKTIEDVPAPEMPIDVSLGVNGEGARKTLVVPDDVDGENIGASRYEDVHSEAMLIDGEEGDELNRCVTISGGDYAEIYLTNEDELISMDVNGKESVDKSSYESPKLCTSSSPKDCHEDDMPDSCQPPNLVSDSCQAVSDSCQAVSDNVHIAEMDVAAKPSHSVGHDDQHDISCSEANVPTSSTSLPSSSTSLSSSSASVPSSSTSLPSSSTAFPSSSTSVPSSSTSLPAPHAPEVRNEVIICTLNTEDLEIPCNDHVFLPTPSVPAVMQPTLREVSELASSTGKRKCDQLKKEGDPAKTFKVPRMVGHDTITENNPDNKLVFCVASISKHDKNVPADARQCRSAHAPPKSIKTQVLKEEGLDAPITIAELAPLITDPGSTKMTFPEPEANPSALDCEESEEESDDEDDDDDDDDIPSFSDIETMILEMDLSPEDQDSYIRIVSPYQDEDSIRKTMRLEQSSRSCMQRDLASKGALAVLYNLRVKEYIKKTEVILGRGTEDNEVDIDLGKEGLHNKISRRQAFIKLEGDGSFSLKNLGKSSMYLNGEEVATGQLVSLGSNDFIQIKGMSFVFEMCHKLVRQYLGKTAPAQKSEDKHTKSEWSPERGP